MPRTTVRVVWGLSEVITIFCPTTALVSVDFPALGRPTKHAKPLRNAPCSATARLVVPRPDLLVRPAGGLARPPDRLGVDGARPARRHRPPVAHHVVRRAGQ